jgi:hypothetical protein
MSINKTNKLQTCEIVRSHGGNYEQYYYSLRGDAVQPGRRLPTFRRSVQPPFSGLKSKQNKNKSERSTNCLLVFTLKMEAVRSSETSVNRLHGVTRHKTDTFYRTTNVESNLDTVSVVLVTYRIIVKQFSGGVNKEMSVTCSDSNILPPTHTSSFLHLFISVKATVGSNSDPIAGSSFHQTTHSHTQKWTSRTTGYCHNDGSQLAPCVPLMLTRDCCVTKLHRAEAYWNMLCTEFPMQRGRETNLG